MYVPLCDEFAEEGMSTMKTIKRSLVGSVVLGALCLGVGSLSVQASPAQEILSVTASLKTWLPTVYRGSLHVQVDANQKITEFTFTETYLTASGWSAPYTHHHTLADFQKGKPLMTTSSGAVVIEVKGAKLDPVTGGAVDLIVARNSSTRDFRLVHLEIARMCTVCSFHLQVNDSAGRSEVTSLDIAASVLPDGVNVMNFKDYGRAVRDYDSENLPFAHL